MEYNLNRSTATPADASSAVSEEDIMPVATLGTGAGDLDKLIKSPMSTAVAAVQSKRA